MTFKNEYVSEEDINKYSLNNMWDRYHDQVSQRDLSSFKHAWTINREKNIFLMFLEHEREEFANREHFLLWWDGAEIFLQLENNGDANFKIGAGRAVWNLVELRLPLSFEVNYEVNKEDVVCLLKEALKEYGFRGIKRQIENYSVDFNF